MTVDYSRVAVYDVRNAMWLELQNANLFNSRDYTAEGFNGPLVPIIPSQQVPEFNNLLPGKTYITYDIIQRPYASQWWISDETMVMQIVSRSNTEILTIINFLTDLFRRYEKSALDLNMQRTDGSPFRFLYAKVESANPIQPFTDEGGFMSGDFSANYTYTRDVDQGASNSGRYI